MACVGRHHVSDVLTDTQSSFGRSSSDVIVYRLNQSSDGHDSIAFVWLRHVPHSCSPNLKRTVDTPDPSPVPSLRCDCGGRPGALGCAARQVTLAPQPQARCSHQLRSAMHDDSLVTI